MTIESELLDIQGDSDLLKPEDVVEWARANKDSELHRAPQFLGWDTKKAAYAHWVQAARTLIALHLVYEGGERRYVSLSIDRVRAGGGYRDVDQVLRDQTLHSVMLEDALRDLQRVESRYQFLKALKPVWKAAAQVRRRKKGRDRPENRPTA